MTPVLQGYTFPKANPDIKEFGAKFEMILTDKTLALLNAQYGKSYVNPRNGVIGLSAGLDARQYRDYFTLVPLETTLINELSNTPNHPRLSEIELMNLYYTRGIDFRYTVIQGSYSEVLFKLHKFVQEADYVYDWLNSWAIIWENCCLMWTVKKKRNGITGKHWKFGGVL